MTILCGSASLDFMYMSASAPDAPPLSETMTGCLSMLCFWMTAWIIRAIWSEAPPAPAATTISTAFEGSQAAFAGAANASIEAPSAQATFFDVCMSFSSKYFVLVVDSFRRGGECPGISGEVHHGGLEPARSVRDAARLEADLDAGKRAGDHEVVKIAEVADAEHRVGERPEAVAERHVAALEDLGPQAVGRMPLRQPHRGERRRIFAWIAALDLEAPEPHRPPCRLGGADVAGEDVVQSLLVQHAERDLQTLQQVGRGRVREIALFIRGDHLVPGPKRPRQLRLLRGRERLVGDRVEGQARRQHQPLLRAADCHVDAPLVVAVVDRAERGDGVDEEERRMSGLVDRAADRGDARGDAGRGLVVDDRDRLDLREPGLDRVRVHTGAPVALDELGT